MSYSKHPPMGNNWYPPREVFSSHDQWEAHVKTLDVVYAHQRSIDEAHQKLEELNKLVKSNVGQVQAVNGPLNTKIVGLNVKPGQPSSGDTLRWDATNAEFTFGA